MSNEPRWRRWIPPLLSALLVATVVAGPASAAYQATLESNVTAFQPPCVGYFDFLPSRMLSAAKTAYTALGYTASAYSGAAFTRAQVMSRTVNDWGFYVHLTGSAHFVRELAAIRGQDSSPDSSSVAAPRLAKATRD